MKKVVIFVGICNLIILLGLGSLAYTFSYAVTDIDKSESLNGKYTVYLQAIGSPFLFGCAKGRLILKDDNHKKSEYEFTLADDGVQIHKESWNVQWKHDFVEITLSGSEQSDEIIMMRYDGKISSKIDSSNKNINVEKPIYNPMPIEEDQKINKITDGYRSIYNQYFKEKGYSFIEDYDTKGYSIVILLEKSSSIEYLVYDRDFQNTNCGIYIYFKCNKNKDGSWSPMEAQIIDFFAYEYSSKKVVKGNKGGWNDLGSDEYRRITGE